MVSANIFHQDDPSFSVFYSWNHFLSSQNPLHIPHNRGAVFVDGTSKPTLWLNVDENRNHFLYFCLICFYALKMVFTKKLSFLINTKFLKAGIHYGKFQADWYRTEQIAAVYCLAQTFESFEQTICAREQIKKKKKVKMNISSMDHSSFLTLPCQV